MTAISMSNLWLNAGDRFGVPEDWPLYDIQEVRVGDRIGPMSYIVDSVTMSRYAQAMGVEHCINPLIPARHTDPLRNSHADDSRNSTSINAKMMIELFGRAEVGELLTLSGEVVEVYERRGKPYVTIQSETLREDGSTFDRLRKTMLLSRKEVAAKWNFLREQ